MYNIDEIIDMISWNQSTKKGIALAKNIKKAFIQPISGKYNKNVWDNCH